MKIVILFHMRSSDDGLDFFSIYNISHTGGKEIPVLLKDTIIYTAVSDDM